jgi:hypothetical protein
MRRRLSVPAQSAPKVFISYKRGEEGYFIKELRQRIEAMRTPRVQVFQDVDMPPGTNWMDTIDLRIQESFAVVVVLTAGSVQSPYVTYEWSYALGAGIGILPLLRHKHAEQDVHGRLKILNWIDCSGDNVPDATWQRIRDRLRTLHTEWLKRDKPPQVAGCLQQLFANTYRRHIGAHEIIDHLTQYGFISTDEQLKLLELARANAQRTDS